MKNLLLVVLFFVATICSAQVELQVNNEGVYRQKSKNIEWVDAEITSDPEALRYDIKFAEAMANPGQKILGERLKQTLKLKLLFKKQVEVKECFIVYNSQTKNIDYLEAIPVIKEESSYLILFSISSILLMIASNILFKKKNSTFVIAIASAAAIFAAFSAFAAAAFSVFAVAAIAAAAIAAAAIAAATITNGDKSFYKILSIIFYILMVIHIVLLFV